MDKKVQNSISITDQILQTLFSSLENQEGFDNEMISQLRDLAERDELTKVDKVTTVLKKDKGQ